MRRFEKMTRSHAEGGILHFGTALTLRKGGQEGVPPELCGKVGDAGFRQRAVLLAR